MPTIENISPPAGWPGGTRADGTFVDGTLIVITGQEFHPTPEMDSNRVTFEGPNGSRINAPVVWASPNEIHYAADSVIDDSNQVVGANEAFIKGLDGLEGIAVADGALYVAVTGRGWIKRGPDAWIQRFFPDILRPDGHAADFIHPSGIAVDDDGNVYVANSGLHRIEVYGPTLLPPPGGPRAWGSEGSGDGEFNFPRAVDAATIGDETFVFIADTYNRRVVRTRTDGSDFRVFQMPDDAGTIQGIAAHAAGDVYCSDPSNQRILHFDADGNFLDEFGATVLDFPLGVDVDFDGFIYVADNGSRTIKKFDTDFRLIAEFGLTRGQVPTTTPQTELVDPVDVAVDEDKSVWIADRRRNHVVRWFPEDAQEIWVHVPEGAITGDLRVETDDGSVRQGFQVFQVGNVSVDQVFVTQGIEEYPPVAGKRTAILIRMATPTTPTVPPQLESFWGSPVTDTTQVRVLRDGVELGANPLTEFQVLGANIPQFGGEATFDLLIELPSALIADPGRYEFRIRLKRDGGVDFAGDIQKEARRRRSLKIGAYVLSHLRPDGTQIDSPDMPTDFFLQWLGDDTNTLSWLDQNTMLSGFAHFNRTFPMPNSLTPITYLGVMPLSGITDGVSDDEQRNILRMLERIRVSLNEEQNSPFDYLMAVMSRQFTATGAPDGFNGVTAPGDWHTAIVSFGRDASLDDEPIPDMGAVAAHEIGHQLGLVQPGPRFTNNHSSNQIVESQAPGWNSLFGFLVPDPISLMFVGDGVADAVRADDVNGFFEQSFEDEPAADYQDLFDGLANPHPPPRIRREVRLDSSSDAPKRPAGSKENYTLLGTIDARGTVAIAYSHVGKPETLVSPPDESDYQLVQMDRNGKELLQWPVAVTFQMLAVSADGVSSAVRPTKTGAFRVTAPWMETTAEVRLRLADRTLATLPVPEGKLSVRILSPRGGENLTPHSALVVRWESQHSADAPLTYRVDYSPDGGMTWELVQEGLTRNELTFHNRPLPGSDKATIRVTASDGFHTANAVSPPFRVARKRPRIRVLWPRNGEVFAQGQPIRMAAVASDAEDGTITGKRITWLLDGRIRIGADSEVRLTTTSIRTPKGRLRRALPLGQHTLTARVVDSDGNHAHHTVTIHVAKDSDGDGYTDEEERECGTDPHNPLDHPGNLNATSFGQWQVSRDGRWTRFEISNLTRRAATIEVRIIREGGQPLADYPITVQEAAQTRDASTNAAGCFQLSLGARASAIFELHETDEADSAVLYGYSTIRLVRVAGSRTATLLAHGWIRQDSDGSKPAVEGTIVIHGGEPFTLQAPLPKRRRFRPVMPGRFEGIVDLGGLIHAVSKGAERRPSKRVRGRLPDADR